MNISNYILFYNLPLGMKMFRVHIDINSGSLNSFEEIEKDHKLYLSTKDEIVLTESEIIFKVWAIDGEEALLVVNRSYEIYKIRKSHYDYMRER